MGNEFSQMSITSSKFYVENVSLNPTIGMNPILLDRKADRPTDRQTDGTHEK